MQLDANGWLDTAIEIDYFDKSMSRQGYTPTHIVLHGTAGGVSAEAVARNVFQDPSIEASAHFIIGQDAHIIQGVPCSLAAWGNGILNQPRLPFPVGINPNYYTISIEHCKPSTDNSDALTPAQQQMSFLLIKALCDYYGIPKRRGDAFGGIVSHADFDSVTRANCPGPYPWDEMLGFITEGGPMLPQGWTDNGTILTAPNHIPITNGFRQWVLSHTWDPANIPLRVAESRNPLERSNPGLGAGNRQVFLLGDIIEWTPAKGVFQAWAGQEFLAVEGALVAVPANITQLASQAEAIITQLQQHMNLVTSDIATAQALLKSAASTP